MYINTHIYKKCYLYLTISVGQEYISRFSWIPLASCCNNQSIGQVVFSSGGLTREIASFELSQIVGVEFIS